MLTFPKKHIFLLFNLFVCVKFVQAQAKSLPVQKLVPATSLAVRPSKQSLAALKSVDLVTAQKSLQGNLSNKLALRFNSLQGFSSEIASKPCDNGNQMLQLTFVGVDEKDSMIPQLVEKLALLKIPHIDTVRPAFAQFSLHPRVPDKQHAVELCLILEFDPQVAKILVSQAGGQDSVEIEVFNCQQLNKLVAKGFFAEAPRLAANDASYYFCVGFIKA